MGHYLEEEAATHHFECGAVIVVADSGIVFEQGYGDCGPGHAPPDPAATVFRAASTSKLFAAVAALQLVERGALGLDVDVREYLPEIPIENPSRTPLTTAHLLTHTSGIEPRMLGALGLTEEHRRPLFEFFRDRQIRLTRKPGRDISYSNLGVALAGLVVFFGIVVLSTVVVGIFRRLRKPVARRVSARARTAERAVALGTAIAVLCPVVVFAGFLVNHPPYEGLPAQVLICVVLLHVLAIVLLAQAYFATRSWLEGWWGLAYRIYYSVAAVAYSFALIARWRSAPRTLPGNWCFVM